MRVFMAGATRFVGSAVLTELLAAGHQVTRLARSDATRAPLKAAGVTALPGDLEARDSMTAGARASDGKILAGFIHDFSHFAKVGVVESRALAAMGKVQAGSYRRFLIPSGAALGVHGEMALETCVPTHDREPCLSAFDRTRKATGWTLTEVGLVADLAPGILRREGRR